MHDPMTVAFEIRRPWPHAARWKTALAAQQRIRWQIQGACWVVAGHGLYWPSLITVWHRDPSGYDVIACPYSGRWRWHVHHWRLQIHALQELRRRLLTRCEVCAGRSTKARPVNLSAQWDSPHSPWWRGERGLTHHDCQGATRATKES